MPRTLAEIAEFVGGQLCGDGSITIEGVSGIQEARPGEITFLANAKYLPLVDRTQASAIVVARDVQGLTKPVIRTDNPSLAFVRVVSFLCEEEVFRPQGIHPAAVVAKDAVLGKDVALGAYAVIEEGAVIGDGTVIYPHVYVGARTRIGANGLIYPNVSIRERVTIGDNVIIHSGAVIGSDGFGFVSLEGRHHKIPQVGTVEIGDDVEIGANVTVDRARFNKTVIARGTKIDNLVQIGHNVQIGADSIIVAQAGVSGSTTLGKNVTIAGQAGLVGHITVGDGAIVAAQAGVTKSVPEKTLVSGYPARPHGVARKVNACVQNLPRLYEQIFELKRRLEELENKTKE